MTTKEALRRAKNCRNRLLEVLLGGQPRLHRIPFGPIRGRKIFMSPLISLRMWFGNDEPWIARLCSSQITTSAVVYDIGAHVGYTTVLFAHYLNGTGVVHAFEILPSTAGLLRKTIEANDFRNVTVHVVGLGVEETTCELPIGKTAMTSIHAKKLDGQKSERCRIVALDNYRREKHLPLPALIKMDIESAEIDCLKGSTELINECQPAMIIAFHSKDLLHQGYALLTTLGYRLQDKRGPVTEDSIARVADSFNDSVLCTPAGAGVPHGV